MTRENRSLALFNYLIGEYDIFTTDISFETLQYSSVFFKLKIL